MSGCVLLCGSRSLSVDWRWVAPAVSAACPGGWLLLSGGARGVDSLAPIVAASLGWEFVAFRPDYGVFGRRAPLVRNCEMASLASVVVAVWDGRSPGTAHAVYFARSLGRPVVVLRPPG